MITSKDLDNIKLFHSTTLQEFLLFDKTQVPPNNKIGWIYYNFDWDDNPKYIELNLIKISEEYKQKGFGKFLITNFIEYFKNTNQYERIYLLAEPFGNKSRLRLQVDDLLKWYELFGFKKDESNFYYLDL